MPIVGTQEIKSLLWERALTAALRHPVKSESQGWNTEKATTSDLLKQLLSSHKNRKSSGETSLLASASRLRSSADGLAGSQARRSPWWLSVRWAAPPRCLLTGFLPARAGRACPAAWAEPSYLSSCTWVWKHTCHPQLLFSDCWPEPVTATYISNLEKALFSPSVLPSS